MKKNGIWKACLFFCSLVVFSAKLPAQRCAGPSPCLVGTYDLRNGFTLLQIIDPTAVPIDIRILFYDDNERFLKCQKASLSSNDLFELDVRGLDLRARFGVVKIFCFVDNKPFPGMVGFQRHYFKEMGMTESDMASVPVELIEREWPQVTKYCQ